MKYFLKARVLIALLVIGSLTMSSCSTFKKCDCPKFENKKKDL